MITFVKSRIIGSTKIYDLYDSEDNKIYINFGDNGIEEISIQTKRFLYPQIIIDVKDPELKTLIKYDTITISEENRNKFEENYKKAIDFTDNELKPFVEKIINGG